MFFFGHLGVGSKIVSPWSEGLPKKALLIGTLLPDLIDKPLYYSLVLSTGRRASDLGLFSGTQSIGHTALFLLALTGIAFARQSRLFAALALGVASHLLIDGAMDHFSPAGYPGSLVAIFFPAFGWRFPVMPFQTFGAHLGTLRNTHIWIGEAIGLLFLGWEWWKHRHRSEILSYFRTRRIQLRRVRALRRFRS